MTRGLTIVEMLVALGLLSALMLSLAAWTRVAGGMSAGSVEAVRWRQAAETVFVLVHDDLAAGDLTEEDRVEVKDGVLEISTRPTSVGDFRERGPVRHRYVRDAFCGRLDREGRTDREERRTRPLIDDVSKWVCEIDEEHSILRVTITSVTGTTLTRSYPLP